MELKIISIAEPIKGISKVEVRVSDADLDISFNADYTESELEVDNWVDKAKNIFLDIKEESKDAFEVLKDFNKKKDLVKHKVIDVKVVEEVIDGEVEK